MKLALFHFPTFSGLLLLVLFIGCSNGSSNPIVPLAKNINSGHGNPDKLPIIASGGNTDIGIMGGYNLTISDDGKSADLVPMRTTAIGESWIVSGRSFFGTFPCKDCFRISGLGYETGKLIVKFSIRHPFPKGDIGQPPTGKNRLDLDLFDLALLVAPKPLSPHFFALLHSNIPEYRIENPDGFTDELSNLIGSQIALPYVLIVDDSLSVPPSSTFNKFEMGSSKEFEVKFPVQPGETLVFDLYLTFGYGASAVLANRLDPDYYNPEFNRKAAWKVKVTPPNGTNPPAEGNTWGDLDNTTEYNVTVKVYDWQIGANVDLNLTNPTDIFASSNVEYVNVEIPGMTNAAKQVDGDSYVPGGTGMPDSPLVYLVPIANERLLGDGEYIGLVEIHDEREPQDITQGRDFLIHSPDGKNLVAKKMPGYRTYQTFIATVVELPIPRTISLLSPNGGEQWNIGNIHDIIWSSTGLTGNVTIDISTDGGANWSPIVSSPGTPNDGSYSWRVAGPASVQARIRVCSIEMPTVCDISVQNFLIELRGNLIWAKCSQGTYWNTGYGITTLSDNSTVVTGCFTETTIFGSGETDETELISPGYTDIFIAKYNPDGTLAWAKRAGGIGEDNSYGIAKLSDNSTIITGFVRDAATFGKDEPNETVLPPYAGFIARYNTDGTLAWAKCPGGSTHTAITSLSDNSIVVTGEFWGTDIFGPGDPNETSLTSVGHYDIFIAKYNSNGTLIWVKRAGGPENDKGFAMTKLTDNSTVITGYFNDTATFGQGESNQTVFTSAGSNDIFIAKYNSNGTLAWAKNVEGSDRDEGVGITTLSDNSTVVSGLFGYPDGGSATFGPGEVNQIVLTPTGNDDIFIARYNPDGTLAWVKQAGGSGEDIGWGITALSDNSIVATGYFTGPATFGSDLTNQIILTSVDGWDIFIARYNPNGTLAWAKSAGGSYWDYGSGITTLLDDSIVVTGSFGDTATFGPGEPNETIMTSVDYDVFIAHFAP